MPDINNKIAYIIAVVNEFSTRFSLNPQQAFSANVNFRITA